MNKVLLILAIISILVFSSCAWVGSENNENNGNSTTSTKKDDWVFKPEKDDFDFMVPMPGINDGALSFAVTKEANIGFSVGGAKDINNFRQNIKEGFLPISSDITYEGLFYGYYFDTGATKECTSLFCPSYSRAKSLDPINQEEKHFLSVGLNSGIKESDFKRKKLNLVIVLDISGSMGSSFDSYYYDRFGNRKNINKESSSSRRSKMEIANRAVESLIDHLKDDDRLGIVVFDHEAYMAKPISKISEVDIDAIKKHILDLTPQGGTNMEEGMELGTKILKELEYDFKEEYDNRIIFITDAMPNTGDDSGYGLSSMFTKNSENGIYTTFIGVGVDFNTELVEKIIKTKGGNYYSVNSEEEFRKTMDEGFDYMVSPIVFDLKLELKGEGFEIEKVYGSPDADASTGELMFVSTLFPSKTEDGEVKGGLVLIQLKKTGEEENMQLKVSYKDINGKTYTEEENIDFKDTEEEFYENTGIRKGILLTRYANLMKSWVLDERLKDSEEDYDIKKCPIIDDKRGIYPPEHPFFPECFYWIELGEWERQSIKLNIDDHYKNLFEEFAKYFKTEMEEIGDSSLKQELEIIESLIGE